MAPAPSSNEGSGSHNPLRAKTPNVVSVLGKPVHRHQWLHPPTVPRLSTRLQGRSAPSAWTQRDDDARPLSVHPAVRLASWAVKGSDEETVPCAHIRTMVTGPRVRAAMLTAVSRAMSGERSQYLSSLPSHSVSSAPRLRKTGISRLAMLARPAIDITLAV